MGIFRLIVMYLVMVGSLWAQDVQMFQPLGGSNTYLSTENADVLKKDTLVFQLYSSYARNTILFKKIGEGGGVEDRAIENLTSFDLMASRSFFGVVDFTMIIPYGFSSGTKGMSNNGMGLMGMINSQNDGSGLNNLRLIQKFRIFDKSLDGGKGQYHFGFGVSAQESLPMKNEQSDMISSFGFVLIKLIGSLKLKNFDISVNGGYRTRFNPYSKGKADEASMGGMPCVIVNTDFCQNPLYRGNAIYYSLGLRYKFNSYVHLLTDIYGRYFYEKQGDNPISVLGAVRFEADSDYFLTMGLGSDFGQQIGTSDMRIVVGVGVKQEPQKDSDMDGLDDKRDFCRHEPEDLDSFEDMDGCPEWDNDLDDIVDFLDRCPNIKEDRDFFEDMDGCPDWDNDLDGIVDEKDICPLAPEDFDGINDMDGCPDEEVIPENAVKVKKGKLISTGKAFFFDKETNVLLPQSKDAIAAVIKALRGDSKISKIAIEVHIDISHGESVVLEITNIRAKAIYDALVEGGIATERLSYKGFGASQPIAPNTTAEGRAMNSRINIRIVEYKD